jgi:hypothetical protein
MQATLQRPASGFASPLIANLVGIVIVVLLGAAVTNTPVPLLGSERVLFVAALALGVTMCALGGVGRAPAKFGWTHPTTLFGIAVGTIMLLLTLGVVLGQITDQAGLRIFAALFAMKWGVGLALVR